MNVGFAEKLKAHRAGTTGARGEGIEGDPTSPNGLRAAVNVTILTSQAGNEETVTHEGSHVADRQDVVRAVSPSGSTDQAWKLNITNRQSEIGAYLLSIGYALRDNRVVNFGPCGQMEECKFSPGMMPALRDHRINELLDDPRNEYTDLDQVLFPTLPR